MNLKYTYIIISAVLLISCASRPNSNLYLQDYYYVTNELINYASKTRDSVYIFDKLSSEDIGKRNFFYLFYYMEKESEKDQIRSRNFKKFLSKHNIDYDSEVSYFREQIDKPIKIDNEKIDLKRFKIQPMTENNTDKYMLRSEYSEYNQNFAVNLFPYSRPIFTKNGKYAITSYGRSHNHNFIIFKKEKNKWKKIDKYNSRSITIIE